MDVRTQIMTRDGEMDIPIHGNDQHHHARVLATSSMVRADKNTIHDSKTIRTPWSTLQSRG